MKTLGILTHENNVITVNGFNFESLTKILAFELLESKARPRDYLYNILFGVYCIDESKSNERHHRKWTFDEWSYTSEFFYNMEIIGKMINKGMISLVDFYKVLFSEKTLRQALCGNYYFPREVTKR